MVIHTDRGTIIYTGKDAHGSLEDCIRAGCNNPDRVLNPCPTVAHELEDSNNFDQPRRPYWHTDPTSPAQLDLLYELGANQDFTDFELDGLTKGEASELIQTYQQQLRLA